MYYQLIHTTSYKYQYDVSSCQNLAILQPRNSRRQVLDDFKLEIEPRPKDLCSRKDFYGNTIHSFSIQESHEELKITAKSIIDRNVEGSRFKERIEMARKLTLRQLKERLNILRYDIINARQFIFDSPLIAGKNKELEDYVKVSLQPERSVYDGVEELMTRIFTDFAFTPGYTDITTPTDEVFESKKGVCQDFAQVAIAGLRSMGIPARYMSGYIETLPLDGQEKLVGSDASHAWFAVFIPGHGWFDFDPTNNQVPFNQHIELAIGRDYSDIVPFKGVIYSTGENTMEVSVDLRQIEEPEEDIEKLEELKDELIIKGRLHR